MTSTNEEDKVAAPPPKAPRQLALYDHHSREEEAELALKHTVLTRPMAWVLVAALLVTILSEVVIQTSIDLRAPRASAAPRGLWMLDVLDLWPSLARADAHARLTGPTNDAAPASNLVRTWNSLPTMGEIQRFEKELERHSWLGDELLPRVQTLQTGILGVGNEQAYTGLDQWLYYRPEIEYLVGEGFLNPAVLQRRARAGDASTAAVQPDPIRAIVQFRDQLAARGITLILMPAPVKPVIQPEEFSRRYAPSAAPIQNPSYAEFLARLDHEGIMVFDCSRDLVAQKLATGRPQYLQTDTHWTPEAMTLAAAKLAGFIGAKVQLPPVSVGGWHATTQEVSNLGDIASMLKLPPGQTLFAPQTVTITRVETAAGQAWAPAHAADVLVLGDSFFNIYSLAGMGWGDSAGFVEQLSSKLDRPLDRIVQNAGGAYASREGLAHDMNAAVQTLKTGTPATDRLAGKRVVIWEFAMRDLAVGDWKLIDLPTAEQFTQAAALGASSATQQGTTQQAPPGELLVDAKVVALTLAPTPGKVPYKEFYINVKLSDLRAPKGEALKGPIGVFVWAMKNNKLTPAATWQPGQRVTLRLVPWTTVEDKYGSYNHNELPDVDDLRLYWAEVP